MGRYEGTDMFNLKFMNEDSLSQKKVAFSVENIELSKIIRNIKNDYSIEGIDELKFSILHNGLKQNLEVSDNNDGTYTLISGERRFTALKALVEEGYEQFQYIPCLVTDLSKTASFLDDDGNEILSDDDKEMWSIITTNSENRDLTDGDRAFQVRELKKIYTKLYDNGVKLPGKMNELIAKELNMSRAQVERVSYIESHGTDELKDKLNNNEISIGAASEVAHLEPEQQKELLQQDVVTSTTVKEHKEEQKTAPKRVIKEKETVELSECEELMKYFEDIVFYSSIIDAYKEDDFVAAFCTPSDYEKLLTSARLIRREMKKFHKIYDKI